MTFDPTDANHLIQRANDGGLYETLRPRKNVAAFQLIFRVTQSSTVGVGEQCAAVLQHYGGTQDNGSAGRAVAHERTGRAYGPATG